MRILCLHGMGTSSKIFAVQTSAIRGALSQTFSATFDFVEGALDCPPAPGITALAGPNASYYAYYNPDDPETITQAADDLAEYVQSEGPFDGVLAFSQGAALAAMVIARDIFPAPFAFAIFICGGPPYSEPAWRAEQRLRYYDKGLDRAGEPVITIPTVHVVGALDKDLPTCMQLVYLCREEVRQFYEHPAGHEIPTSSTEITRRMVEVMQRGIERAMLAQ